MSLGLTLQANETQALTRPADDARQHAPRRARAGPQFVGLPTFMNANN